MLFSFLNLLVKFVNKIVNFSCIIQRNYFYFGLLFPVAIILLMNIFILILVMVGISNSMQRQLVSSVEKEDYKRILLSCRIAFALSTLLGLTWGFGIFALGRLLQMYTLIIKLLFFVMCYFNSLSA